MLDQATVASINESVKLGIITKEDAKRMLTEAAKAPAVKSGAPVIAQGSLEGGNLVLSIAGHKISCSPRTFKEGTKSGFGVYGRVMLDGTPYQASVSIVKIVKK